MSRSESHSRTASPRARFAPTHWSVVLAAAGAASRTSEAAMESLCGTYWFPVYAYLRRKGLGSEEAKDLTQEFFARVVISGRIFRGINPAGGKFRTWLLKSLTNFMHNETDRKLAQKRGGGAVHLSIDFLNAEGQYVAELRDDLTPEKLYDRAWASALLQKVLTKLQASWAAGGEEREFRELKCFLPGAYCRQPYAEVALRLGKSEEAVKTAVCRLRKDYGKLLLAEVEQTVSSKAETQDELRYLTSVIGN